MLFFYFQELRQMEHLQTPSQGRRMSVSCAGMGSNQMKSEYMLLAKKYERLAAKERRMQVRFKYIMNSMKLAFPLHSLYWSIHTKDESKRGIAFAFIFGVN